MSSLLSAELAATCNALGSLDKRTGKYLIDEFTLDTVKDLIRYLRRDDEDHEIRRHLGQTKVLETDLLPILINHSEEAELFDVTLRLVVNLTNPPLLLYREEIPTEKSGRRCYLQMVSHLSSYKANSFTNPDVWTVLTKRLTQMLEIDSGERNEDSGLIIERILILVRNILHIPADDHDEKRPDNDASIHDQVLWALNQSGLLDVILYMSSENEKAYFMHILEIISLALREQNPTSLADAALQRSVDEKLRDEQELLAIRFDEVKKRNEKIRNFSANRHSRFGGTFVVQNMKSISDNSLICHKPLNKVSNFDFSLNKIRTKKPKNRQPAGDISAGERRSAFAIRLFLKEFCTEFLNASYNTMMYHVKDVLVRAKAQKHDETYYMWAMKFFMEFNRNYNFQVKLVSETMSVSTFHYVQQQMEKCYEMLVMDKKNTVEWVRRLHLSLKAYHELLETMTAMDKSSDQSVKESSMVLKSNIFYVLEYREFILQMLLSYEETKMPKAYLKDLIETVYIFLRMLEQFCSKHGLVVQKKVRSKIIKKGKKKDAAKDTSPKQMTEELKNSQWEELKEKLSAILNGESEITTDFIPFDATLEKDIDEQKGDCTKKIQKLLLDNRLTDAVGLLRAGREVWPENDIFGNESLPPDEELEVIKMIFMANIGAEQVVIPGDQREDEGDNEDEEDEEYDEEGPSAHIVEADFSFDDFINRFSNPKVVKACSILLQMFDKNTLHTNKCVVKMLHRIAWDCKQPSMVFQASIFRAFQRILSSNLDQYKELQKFAIFIVRKFTEVALRNPKVFMEILFWKNCRDVYGIENGYDESENINKKGNVTWTEEEEEELRKLYNENQSNPATDMDVIDWLLDNLIERNRTRRGVINKLKELGLIFKAPTKKSNAAVKHTVPVEFNENEDEKLKELWEEFGQSTDPMVALMSRMPIKRPRHRFVTRLLELGLIQSTMECRKNKKSSGHRSVDNEGADQSSENSDSDSAKHKTQPKKTKKIAKKTSTSKKSNSRSIKVSSFAVAKTLMACVEKGFTEALRWVCESLEEVALDQEAEGYNPDGESIPLVPIMPDCVVAMENVDFQETLKCLGIEPPGDEQEIYWRISGNIHFDSLRKRCDTIMKAVEKTLVIPEEVENAQDTREITQSGHLESANAGGDSSSSDEDADDFFNRIRLIGKHQDDLNSVDVTNEEDISNRKSSLEVKRKNDKRKRIINSDDDDVDFENESNNLTNVNKRHAAELPNSESRVDDDNIIITPIVDDSTDSVTRNNFESKGIITELDSDDDMNISVKSSNKRISKIVIRNRFNSKSSDDATNEDITVTTSTKKVSAVKMLDKSHDFLIEEESEEEVSINKRKKRHLVLTDDSDDSVDIQIRKVTKNNILPTIDSDTEMDDCQDAENNTQIKSANLAESLFDSLIK